MPRFSEKKKVDTWLIVVQHSSTSGENDAPTSTITARCDPSLLHSQGVYSILCFCTFCSLHLCRCKSCSNMFGLFFCFSRFAGEVSFLLLFHFSLVVCLQAVAEYKLVVLCFWFFFLIVELLKTQHLCLILIFGA